MLSGVAVVLTIERQTVAFRIFLRDRPEFIPYIHALWTITTTSIDSSLSTFSISVEVILDIIAICTNLRSLASNPSILYMAVFRHRTLVHTHLVDLTMLSTGLHSYWHRLRAFEPGAALVQQLESLHIIVVGTLERKPWDDVFPPKMNNLSRLSISMGSQKSLAGDIFIDVIESPRLQQVVITSHLRGEEQQELSDVVQGIDDRFSVVPHRSDSSESEWWHENLLDPGRFWNDFKKGKCLLPLPTRSGE
jgi:hypothetical protein